MKIKIIGKSTALLIMMFFLFASCSKKVSFQNSSIVPSAEGMVKIKQDNNKNYEIQLYVDGLVDPSRLTPPQNVYVVWMETSYSGTQNIGQLKSSTKGMSRMPSSSLRTVSTHKPTNIFITAEAEGDRSTPSNLVVLKTGYIVYD